MTAKPAYSPKPAVAALFLFTMTVALIPVVYNGCSGAKGGSVGLRGKYYRNAKWEGAPVDVQVDQTIDFDWSKSPPYPAPFSADWTGNVLIEQPGNYQFALISDDGSLLEIDGRVVVDATTVLLQKQTGAIELPSGPHSIHVKYFNTLFGGSVRLFWTPPARPEQIVPAEVLRPAGN
jgi:hypothetical protein